MESASNSSDQTKPEPIADGGKSVGVIVVVVVDEVDVVGAWRGGGGLTRFANNDFDEADLVEADFVEADLSEGEVIGRGVDAVDAVSAFAVFGAFVAASASRPVSPKPFTTKVQATSPAAQGRAKPNERFLMGNPIGRTLRQLKQIFREPVPCDWPSQGKLASLQ
jgi:hypothetical protein